MIAGGVDSYFEADTLTWLDRQRRLARPDIRSGFPPGEGVALIAVGAVIKFATSLVSDHSVECAVSGVHTR